MLFIPSAVDWHLGDFQFWIIINNGALTYYIRIYKDKCIHFFLAIYSGMKLLVV